MTNESESGSTDVEMEEFDDSTPVWEVHQQAVVALQAHEGEGFESLTRGGRDATVVDWDFNPLVLPSYVHLTEHPSDQEIEPGFFTVTNRSGNVTSFQIFNPDLRTEEQPIGAVLGEVSERYAAVSYPITFAPFAEMCSAKGWPWEITCYDQGKVARMDIVVADAAEIGTNKANRRVGDVYKYGLTIHNSLDGSSGLRVTAYAERLVCTNGMVAMRKRNLFSAKHTAGAIGSIDFEKFAREIGEMALTVKNEILLVESMKGMKLTDELFDKLQVEAARRGIITMPRVFEITDPITGKVIDYDVKGGHGWRIGREGWENPDRDWVKVEGEDIGTLFQAYQIMTGGLTHKPVWDGPATWNGEKHSSLNGYTLNLKTLEKRLHSVHILLSEVMSGSLILEELPTSEQKLGIELVH
tara:strand:- start:18314 stop:19549 length:1236 start_codon:yes stop_codon:yes gene_type:complete